MADKSEIIREAQKYLSRGQIDKAIAEWEKLLKESPDGNIYNTIGDLHLKRGDKKSAVEYFHKSAAFFREEGFSPKAMALYKKILNTDTSNVNGLVALGELSEEKGLITDAIKYYLSAADILSKESKKDRFVSIYERILSLAPYNIPLREKVAGLFMKEGLIPNAAREHLNIARLYEERGDYDQSIDYFRRAIDSIPDNKDALLGIADIFEKRGDIRQALDYVKRAVKISPDDPDLFLKSAALLKNLGLHDEAISCLSKAIGLRPSDVAAHRLLGDIYFDMDNIEGAWECYRIVIDSLLLENNFEDAASVAEKFRDVKPIDAGRTLIGINKQKDNTEAVFRETLFVAERFLEAGLNEEAIRYYREALKIHPDDMILKKLLAEQEMKMGLEPSAVEKEKTAEELIAEADIFVKYGLYDEARAVLEELKVNEPTNIDVHLRLKSFYLEVGDAEQAVTECLIISEIYGRAGDVSGKETALKEAFEISPDDPRLADRMAPKREEAEMPPEPEMAVSQNLEDYAEEITEAEFYMRQGLNEDALRIYQKLLKIFPDNNDFKNRIASIWEPAAAKEEIFPETGEEMRIEEEVIPTETFELQEIVEPQFDSDVLDIFHEFKKGLEKELDVEDSETHYNLGIAYKEMGLVDDAIKEFQTSRGNPEYYIRSASMLGLCYMEKGLFPLAIDAFSGALDRIETQDESYWGAKYDLASAHEKNGDLKEAFDAFSEVYGWNSGFRQVTEKVNSIKEMIAQKDSKQKEKKDRVSYL